MNKMSGSIQTAVIALIIFIGLWIVPIALEGTSYLNLVNTIGIYSIAVIGLNLIVGITGILSMGHAAFFGLGGYTAILLSTHLSVNPFIAILISCVFIALLSALFAAPLSKLTELFMALASLGFGVILFTIINSGKSFTGGPNGMAGFPPLSIGGYEFNNEKQFFYLIWLSVILVSVLVANLLNSRIGRALKAIHSDEVAASSIGIPTRKFKVVAFSLGCTIAAFAGSLLAYYMQFISPNSLSMKMSINMLVMSYLGGISTVIGGIIGSAVYQLIPQLLLQHQEYELIIQGIILLVIILYFPGGIYKGVKKGVHFLKNRFGTNKKRWNNIDGNVESGTSEQTIRRNPGH